MNLVVDVWSRRPVSSSTCSVVDEINNILRENCRKTLNEITESCNMSYGSARDIIQEKLGYRKICSRGNRNRACSRKKLRRNNEEGDQALASIVTGYGICALHITVESNVASMMWKNPFSFSRKKLKVSPTTTNLVITVFWNMKGLLQASCPLEYCKFWSLLGNAD